MNKKPDYIRYASTYSSWSCMKSRCKNPNATSYKRYGALGISYCPEWEVFQNFLRDMGARPNGYSIDRINTLGNYCKENCRWATRMEQNNNAKSNRVLELHGRKQNIGQWARELGTGHSTLIMRLDYYGWSVEKTLQTKIRKTKKYVNPKTTNNIQSHKKLLQKTWFSLC